MASSTGFEALLGPPQDRYFGAGYRKTAYELRELRPDASNGSTLEGIATVRYAADWSIRAGVVRTPHLSTVDVIVLTSWMAQAYLSSRGFSDSAIAHAWIPEIFLRAGGRPVNDLDRVRVQVDVTGTGPAMQTNWGRKLLKINVGTLSATAILEHEAEPARCRPLRTRSMPIPEVFGVLFRNTDHRVCITQVDSQGMRCRIEFTPQNARPTGLAAAYWPSATFMDSAAIAGQMTQIALMYNSKRSREASTNMWIRKIRFQASEPRHPTVGSASLQVAQFGVIRHGNTTYTTCETEMSIAGVRVAASVAEADASPT
ncbi:AvrD family protein [Agromyces aerolatus]|uniref:AvrD family protein n=1 Tax=Agromyces sp. LY-1074 TaxID=3074080 RepID=UPI002865EA1F|nr:MULTISPECIES: AvrD family protein [unclassified Agromyces]MDR5699770.1 AvrD family protein [Agromyces sp. LY-1074]MDR5706066.1 AvrD family protein [Agromyces sp. LY-1358]